MESSPTVREGKRKARLTLETVLRARTQPLIQTLAASAAPLEYLPRLLSRRSLREGTAHGGVEKNNGTVLVLICTIICVRGYQGIEEISVTTNGLLKALQGSESFEGEELEARARAKV